MPESVFGLPVHPLLVHATVVLVPLASLALLLHVLWPEARRRLGIVTPGLAVVALVLVPLSTESGESLEHRLAESAQIERHAELADGMLPWALALAGVAIGVYVLERLRSRREVASAAAGRSAGGVRTADAGGRAGAWASQRWVSVVTVLLALVAVGGTVQQVVRVGHSGATATWSDLPTGASSQPGGDRD